MGKFTEKLAKFPLTNLLNSDSIEHEVVLNWEASGGCKNQAIVFCTANTFIIKILEE